MQWNYTDKLPADFAAASRVWIYQSSRPFSAEEETKVNALLKQFANSWLSHGAKVKGYGQLFFNQFIVLMADEAATGVSGCSTDSSVRLIKQVEEQFSVNMFDRQSLAFIIDDAVKIIALPQLKQAVQNHTVSADTLYFNNLVQTKEALESGWLQPIKNSWLANRILS